MDNAARTKPPSWYWVASVMALLWWLFGVFACLSTVTATEASLQPMLDSGQVSQAYIDYMLRLPIGVKVLFAIATIGGTLACIGLLMRKAWARMLFIVSLAAVLLMYGYNYFFSGASSTFPIFDHIIAMIVTFVTIVMILFSTRMTTKGILR